jgi:hypothetical protein
VNSASYLVSALVIAFLFYLLIPGLGAFLVRHRWRRFREEVVRSTTLPALQYGELNERTPWRFSGRLEAVQGDDLVWLEEDGISVGVSLRHVPIFMIPGGSPGGSGVRGFPDETPKVVYWREISALAQGTRFYVAGHAVEEAGGVVFSGDSLHDPLVIIYDGPETAFLKRTIWTGRQRNEYWNHLTLPSLTGGFLAELVVAVVSVGESRLVALVATVMALVPILPLVPPGVAGYYLYRRLWRDARRRRAIRDVVRLGREHKRSRDTVVDMPGRRIWMQELLAVAFLLAGVWANGYGIAVVLALTIFRR